VRIKAAEAPVGLLKLRERVASDIGSRARATRGGPTRMLMHSWQKARPVNWTAATRSLPDPIVDDLLKKYLLHEYRAMIVSFLDLLKIPQSQGMTAANFDYANLTNEQVQEAARSLLAFADRMGTELYLKYLAHQGGPWAGIDEILPTGE